MMRIFLVCSILVGFGEVNIFLLCMIVIIDVLVWVCVWVLFSGWFINKLFVWM